MITKSETTADIHTRDAGHVYKFKKCIGLFFYVNLQFFFYIYFITLQFAHVCKSILISNVNRHSKGKTYIRTLARRMGEVNRSAEVGLPRLTSTCILFVRHGESNSRNSQPESLAQRYWRINKRYEEVIIYITYSRHITYPLYARAGRLARFLLIFRLS